MELQTLYKDWSVLSCNATDSIVKLYIQSCQTFGYCPSCQKSSSRIHSRYWRAIQDTPILSLQVTLHVRARKFFCDNPTCSQRIFTERNISWWVPYARRTNRLMSFLRHLAFTLSAEAASKISIQYGNPVSADIFLYLARKTEAPSIIEPSIIGIDDWAIKKGQRYGSIVCDLQTHKPIALLTNRTVQEVSSWLQKYPSIKIVTRDGSTEFAKGIREGCPNAIQITDRWHLFHNLSQKVEQCLKRVFPKKICLQLIGPHKEEHIHSIQSTPDLTVGETRKWELIQRVQKRYKEGCKKADIIREFALARKTINKYLRLKQPPRFIRSKRHSADPYRSIILELLQVKATVNHICSVVQEQGYNKSPSTLKDYITKLKKHELHKRDVDVNEIRVSRSKLLTYLWSQLALTQEQQIVFDKLFEQHSVLHQLKSVISAFQELMHEQKNEQALESWLIQAEESKILEIQQFAKYIRTDMEAVKYALSYPWSNGIVEGQVNRLKVIKRQMYGRAKLDLLSKKVLYQFN